MEASKVTEATEKEDRDDSERPASKRRSEKNGSGRAPVLDSRANEDASTGMGNGVKNVMTIARRELRSYFDSLIGYVVICLSLLGIGVYFFMYQQGGFWQVDRATMGRLFDAMPWALSAIVIPAVTMRSLADEKRTGTIELLITMPITDAQVILGKYLAALGLATILLLMTLIYPFGMFVWPWHLGALDWGPVWAGYLGLFLFSAAGVGVGLMFSSFTENQIVALFATALTLLFLQAIGTVVETLHGVIGDAIAFVSFQARFAPFARGLIDTRAVVFFLSVAVLCNVVAFRSLESRKWN
jgi:ABC-2 type transport system permease protein